MRQEPFLGPQDRLREHIQYREASGARHQAERGWNEAQGVTRRAYGSKTHRTSGANAATDMFTLLPVLFMRFTPI